MAVLPDVDRVAIWRWFMRRTAGGGTFTKTDLKAAVDAADVWCDSNAAAFNTALPAAFRTGASAAQKTDLLCFVAQRRAGRLKTEEES
jgi:hypothetical protein